MNLNVSTLFFELAVIFLPGFIWMKIHMHYGAKGTKTQFDMILNAFIFGIIAYATLLAIYSVKGTTLNILNIDSDSKRLLDPKIIPEIVYAIIIAVSEGIIYLYIENFKLFTLFVQWIKATKTFGDEDVWDFMFNSRSNGMGYVHFRDFAQHVVYAGYVGAFSESGELRELLLTDVVVYDFEGTKMYEIPRLYLARERDDIHIEFPS
ncbi:MAG: hypothetical protein ACYC5H_17635 [Methylovirgula sp.]